VNLCFHSQYFFYLARAFFCLVLLLEVYFFFILISCRGRRVSWVNSGRLRFFSSIFLWFFFQFHHFAINYWPLSFVVFLLFFMFGYSESGLIKLTRVGFGFFWCFFFNWTLVFFARSSFWCSFFYPDLISRVVSSLSYPKLTRDFFFDIIFLWCFF
jgi:hypothetical protein